MIRTFIFHDELARIVGHQTLEFDADTPLLLISALRHQIPAFAEKANTLKMGFVAKDGDEYVPLKLDQVDFDFGDVRNVHCIAVVDGSGIETAVLALATAFGVSAVAATAIILATAAVVVGVVVATLAPTPSSVDNANAEKKESFIWQGVENVTEQGRAIPLMYGTFLTGSIVVSADVLVDEERLSAPTPAASPVWVPLYEPVYEMHGA